MGKSTAQRQREWKARQRAQGKKPLSVMLSVEAFEILEKEQERTGEILPDIVERAILGLCDSGSDFQGEVSLEIVETEAKKNVTGNNIEDDFIPDDRKKVAVDESVSAVEDKEAEKEKYITGNDRKEDDLDERDVILKRICEMKDDQGVSFGEIARRFNSEGLQTFSGKGKWHGKTVSKMYWKVRVSTECS